MDNKTRCEHNFPDHLCPHCGDGTYPETMDINKEAEQLIKQIGLLLDFNFEVYGHTETNRALKVLILQYTEKICREQRKECERRASHFGKPEKLYIGLSRLLTDSPAICGDEKQNLTDKQ